MHSDAEHEWKYEMFDVNMAGTMENHKDRKQNETKRAWLFHNIVVIQGICLCGSIGSNQ